MKTTRWALHRLAMATLPSTSVMRFVFPLWRQGHLTIEDKVSTPRVPAFPRVQGIGLELLARRIDACDESEEVRS